MGKRHEDGGSASLDTAFTAARDYVGENSHFDSSTQRDVSDDGTRSVRWGNDEIKDSHIHFETLSGDGKTVEEANYVKITSYD